MASLLHTEEEKLAASTILSQAELNSEEVLPLTDIHEELDDEGNIIGGSTPKLPLQTGLIVMIASSTSVPNQTTPQVVEALRKAGLPLAHESDTQKSGLSRQPDATIDEVSEAKSDEVAAKPESDDLISNESDQSTPDSSIATADDQEKRPAKLKKRVSFANGTKAEPICQPHPKSITTQERTALLNTIYVEIDQEINKDAMVTKFKRICNKVNVPDVVLQDAMRTRKAGVADGLLKQEKFRDVRRLFKTDKLSRRQAAEKIVEFMEENDRHVSALTPRPSSSTTTKGDIHDWEAAPNTRPISAQANDRMHREIKDHMYKEARQLRELREAGGMRMDTFQEEILQMEQVKKELDEAVENATITTVKANRTEERSQDLPNQAPKDDETNAAQSFVVPANESVEDAALRRQMIKYNMDEVGVVVAELNIDDDDHASNSDDDSDDIDFSSAEEEEDGFGRTSTRVLDNEYLEEMRALEKKLNARAMVNIGPEPGTTGIDPSRNGKPANGEMSDGISEKNRPAGKKAVRFANELDVQDVPLAAITNNPSPSRASTIPNPTQKPVVERTTPAEPTTDASHSPKKRVSRFKSARSKDSIDPSTNSQPMIGSPTTNVNVPTNIATIDSATPKPTFPTPPTTPHAPTIIERPYTSTTNPALPPTDPDELDPTLLKQHVSTEYHRLRNRMIQREGGFLAPNEDQAEIPLTEEEGGPKKMSRFKAARLGHR